ncbi:Glutaredoxin-3 [Orbilia brochopaga]|nr:Glutaredoxin-3 [Drechslerella brochopaga]
MAPLHTPTTVDAFKEVYNAAPANVVLAISFHTSWATPCKQMDQVFAALAATTSSDRAVFVSIDAEEVPDISEEYDVSSVPFFVLVKGREIVGKISGADTDALTAAVQSQTDSAGKAPSVIPPAQKVVVAKNTAADTNGDVDTSAVATADEPADTEPEESLDERLRKLVNAAPVMLFMKGTPANPQCGFSRQLVAILREHNIRYGFFNILKDDEVRQGLKEYSDWPTYPQLYHQGSLVGGLDIVKEEFENDPEFLRSEAVAS